MKIAQKYSHLNGEEYLIVHHKPIYDEIINIIQSMQNLVKQNEVKNIEKLERFYIRLSI